MIRAIPQFTQSPSGVRVTMVPPRVDVTAAVAGVDLWCWDAVKVDPVGGQQLVG
jgi:hypothetical protein